MPNCTKCGTFVNTVAWVELCSLCETQRPKTDAALRFNEWAQAERQAGRDAAVYRKAKTDARRKAREAIPQSLRPQTAKESRLVAAQLAAEQAQREVEAKARMDARRAANANNLS